MSRKAVIRRIVQREMQKRGLTEESVLQEAPELHQLACKWFGAWETALKYAGINLWRLYARPKDRPQRRLIREPRPKGPVGTKRKQHSRHRRWTPQLIIETIQCRQREGKPLNYLGVIREDSGLFFAGRKHFGGWDDALRAAGLEPAEYRKRRNRLKAPVQGKNAE